MIKILHSTGKPRTPFLTSLILFELSWASKILIILVFWIFLFKEILESPTLFLLDNVLVHVLPFLSFVIAMAFSKIRFCQVPCALPCALCLSLRHSGYCYHLYYWTTCLLNFNMAFLCLCSCCYFQFFHPLDTL